MMTWSRKIDGGRDVGHAETRSVTIHRVLSWKNIGASCNVLLRVHDSDDKSIGDGVDGLESWPIGNGFAFPLRACQIPRGTLQFGPRPSRSSIGPMAKR